MLWVCFAVSGTGNNVKFNGIMRKEDYKQILTENIKQSAKSLKLGRRWMFQHNNDPKHTSHLVTNWLRSNKIKVLQWPALSPDLNTIENMWQELKRRVHHRHPRNLNELFVFCQEEWNQIPPEFCQKLVDGYQRRLVAVKQANGRSTKY